MPEVRTLPAFAMTSTTETRLVGGRMDVEPGGGSWKVVVVVDVVVEVDVEVVEEVVAPGIVEVVLVDVVVVEEVVVVGGNPVILTTGGCTVTATITRSW